MHSNPCKDALGDGGELETAGPGDHVSSNLYIARLLGWLAAMIGAIILAGWILDLPLLRSLFPQQAEAKFNTAVCLILIGVALGLKAGRAQPTGPMRLRMAGCCAALGALTGLLTLCEYALGWDLGIDELLFRDSADATYAVFPGRMAVPTAFSFLLSGMAVLVLQAGRGRTVITWLVAPVVALVGLAFVGELFDFPALASFGPFTPIAVPTGLAFSLLCAGVLFAEGGRLIARLRQHAQTAGLLLALLLFLLMSGAVVRNTRALIINTREVAHAHEVIEQLSATLSAMQDVETGSRGYLLTGDPSYLEPYTTASGAVVRLQQELHHLTTDNPAQQRRVGQLEALINRKLTFTSRQNELRKQGDAVAAQAAVAAGEGKRLMDAIRQVVVEMQQTEIQLRQERQARTGASTLRTLLSLGLGLATAAGLLVIIFAMLRRELTRRRQTETALRRSEEKLAVTLHSIGDAVLSTDASGRVTLMNRIAERLTGWTLAEARGRPIADIFRIFHEETRRPARIPVDDVLATGEIHGLANHTLLIARDGTEHAIADSAAPIRDRDDRVLGVVLVFRDVTTERMAQRELDRFFSLSLDFLCISSADGYFKRISPAVTDVLGWSVEEFLAKPYIDLVHPDDRAATQHEVEQQVVAGEKVLRFENRYRHKDGSWRVLSWRSVPQPGGLMYATARDVTEQKRKEEHIRRLNLDLQERANELEKANAGLEQSRAELNSLFESLPGLYLVLKRDYHIIAASDAYLQATLTRREDIVGRGLFEVFPDNPNDPAADGVRNLRASLDRVAEHKKPDTMAIQKYDVRRPDGTFEEKYWSPINSPLLGADGQVIYIIHRVEDVTDFMRRKKAAGGDEAELRQRMEAEIFQSSQKVQAVNQQLQAANAELESFSYSVSHDLRAPLRHVRGYVEMLTREAESQLTEKGRRYLQTIADAAREMSELIDDLLAFSRMGRSEMQEAVVDLGALVAETRQGLEPVMRGRNIRWQIGTLPAVRGDPSMLRQVLVNLLGNAVKYTRKRDAAEIEIGCDGMEDGRIVLFVRDNGAGFDMQYAGKLFGVFQRLHRADEFEGTGIGLASVQRIIHRHGGRIWAQGQVDAGATFYITLRPAISNQDSPPPRL